MSKDNNEDNRVQPVSIRFAKAEYNVALRAAFARGLPLGAYARSLIIADARALGLVLDGPEDAAVIPVQTGAPVQMFSVHFRSADGTLQREAFTGTRDQVYNTFSNIVEIETL